MKRLIFLFFLLFTITGGFILAQDSPSEINKLTATAKVWGFLKYYHPEVAEGKFDWDQELFRILPAIKSCKSKEEISEAFLSWIKDLGPITPCKKCERKNITPYFDKNFDLNWLNDSLSFTPELSKKLNYIRQNRHQGNKHFVSAEKESRVDILNEKEYENFDWQNEQLRLLTLFRYWNIVEYFFPYKYLMDSSWDEVLTIMIPRFLNAKSEVAFKLAITELVVHLDDSHALIYNEKDYCVFGCYLVPFKFKLIEDKAVISGFYNDSLAELNNLKIGDIITKIDDQQVAKQYQARESYIHGSNESRKKFNSNFYLFNGFIDSTKIELVREGETHTKFIKRYLYEQFKIKRNSDTEGYKIMDGNIGYINMGEIAFKEVKETMKAMAHTKAIIFDIRNSSPTTLYYFLRYITSEKRPFYKATYPDLDYPGRFIWAEMEEYGSNNLEYGGEVVLLVDESVQSQGEFTAMCLQAGDNVTTIGSQTAGADGNVSRFKMANGLRTQITGIGIYYPSGTETQRKGVRIDIEVKPTINAIIDGKDAILERAIEFVNE